MLRSVPAAPAMVPPSAGKKGSSMASHDELLKEFQDFAKTAPSADKLMERMVHRLHEQMARYNWAGFYLVDTTDPGVLVVGPFAGSFTPNARIPLGQGLCGAAARTGEVVVVDDVALDPRYLVGSSTVRSEIVVPINIKGKLGAVLDIESYFTATFNAKEQQFAMACADLAAKSLAKN